MDLWSHWSDGVYLATLMSEAARKHEQDPLAVYCHCHCGAIAIAIAFCICKCFAHLRLRRPNVYLPTYIFFLIPAFLFHPFPPPSSRLNPSTRKLHFTPSCKPLNPGPRLNSIHLNIHIPCYQFTPRSSCQTSDTGPAHPPDKRHYR